MGLGLPLAGGAVFGYVGRSFWWAVVAVIVAWLVFAVLTAVMEGWDVGPGQDVVATVFLSVYLAGATLLGGVFGKYLASRPKSP